MKKEVRARELFVRGCSVGETITDLFCETGGITSLWECGLHLLVLNEGCDEVART